MAKQKEKKAHQELQELVELVKQLHSLLEQWRQVSLFDQM